MKVIIVKSLYSDTPLAECRTDNRMLDFIVDNTKGHLPKIIGKSYQKLLDYVKNSSHLSIEEPQEPTAHLLRYVLTSGDVVEITTDGRTALLNGKMLAEEEKQSLFEAIRTKQLSIKIKTDPSQATPVMPIPSKVSGHLPESKPVMDREMIHLMSEYKKHREEVEKKYTSNYDPRIEKVEFSDSEGFSPEFGKQLLYLLKYGKTKGS